MSLTGQEEHVAHDRILALKAQRHDVLDYCAELTDEQWNTPSRAAGWRVRDVIAHMGASCRVLFSPEMIHLLRTEDLERNNDHMVDRRHSNDGLTLGTVDVQSVKDSAAALNVCYAYNHSWYVNADNINHAPGASEANVQLVNVNNNWYLHGITDDHVVPSCGASNS
jgi:hypothetical protein